MNRFCAHALCRVFEVVVSVGLIGAAQGINAVLH
jgi:hypothetical protein